MASRMQDLALAEGALPRHLHTAMFTYNTNDNRLLTNRQLSRHLIALWVTGHATAMQLLRRCLVRIVYMVSRFISFNFHLYGPKYFCFCLCVFDLFFRDKVIVS